jgi:hypothetical protein
MARTLLECNADMVHVAARPVVQGHRKSNACGTLAGVLLCAAVLMLTSRTIAAQDADPPAVSPMPLAGQGNQNLQLGITRCGQAGSPERMAITFVDEHHNVWYRATRKGLNLTDSKRLYVIGGLLPTWNLAAQAGSEGGTAPGNTVTAIAWTLPDRQLGASPYPAPKVRIAWVPTGGSCQTP